MTDQMNDWDKQMAQIDKAMARMPTPAPEAPTAKGGRTEAAARGGGMPARGRAGATWLRVGLAGLLVGGLTQWPYAHACGLGLTLYLGAVAVATLGAGWAAVASWRSQRPRAHVVSLVVLLGALGLVAHEVLPRIGYAREALTWLCP